MGWLSRHTKWSDLRAFGRATLLRFAFGPALVGFLVGALLDDGQRGVLYTAATALAGYNAAVLFFVGCLGLSAGVLVYDICCPSHIRRFETDFEFYNAQKEALESFKRVFELKKGLYEELDPHRSVPVNNHASIEQHIDSQETYHYGEFDRVFIARWSDVDKKRVFFRWFCAILFYTSAALVFFSLLLGSIDLARRAWSQAGPPAAIQQALAPPSAPTESVPGGDGGKANLETAAASPTPEGF